MPDKVFVDTNVLVYAYDKSAPEKHEAAQEIIAGLWESGLGLISPQVLQEFYVTVTKKLKKPLAGDSARTIVADLCKWSIVAMNGEDVLAAIDIQLKHQLSFWDSMIVHAARKGGASLLLSEDLNDGQEIGEVLVKNPF